MRTYASSRAKTKIFCRKSELQLFLLISGGHTGHQFGTPICRLHRKLYKGAWNVSANNSETVNHKDLRLEKIVYILVFYNISFSWLLPLDGFQFIFLVAWQWKRSILGGQLWLLWTFPWSQSKVEVDTFYLFKLKVGSNYTYIILEALVWCQQLLACLCSSFIVRNLCLGTYRRNPFFDYCYLIFLLLCIIRVKSFVTVYCKI